MNSSAASRSARARAAKRWKRRSRIIAPACGVPPASESLFVYPSPNILSALLDELVLEQGENVSGRLSGALGISREEASRVLPATGDVILDRFEPGTCDRGGGDPHPVEASRDPERSLDGILAGTGHQLSERLHMGFGLAPEEAARTIPLLVPVILRFILRRTPYGSMASSVLSDTVARQGEGSLDALALRLAKKVVARPPNLHPVKPASGVTAFLGRWAGKWFPEGGN